MKSILRGHVDGATEQLLKVKLLADEIEKAATGLKVDEDVQITIGCRVNPVNRAEVAYDSGSMLASDCCTRPFLRPYSELGRSPSGSEVLVCSSLSQ